jgi:hypothetical protein
MGRPCIGPLKSGRGDTRQSGGLELNGLSTVSDEAARRSAQYKGNLLSLDGLTTLNADTGKAIAATKVWDGELPNLTMLDAATANSLAQFKGEIWLTGLQRTLFGAVRALRQNPRIGMPNHWYLLRYEIASLVGTVVLVVMAGIVVWYSRRQRDAALS